MDINKQKLRLIKRFNTIKINLNKDLHKSSQKENQFNKDQIKANANIQELQKFIKDKNLSKHLYPIKVRNVHYKGIALKDKRININKKLAKVDDIISYINTATDQNDLTVLNHLIDDNYIFAPTYYPKSFSKCKIFDDKLNIDFIPDDLYLKLAVKIGDIYFQIKEIYYPVNYGYSYNILYDILIDDKKHGSTNYYSSETREMFYKLSEDAQINIILAILTRINQKNSQLDNILLKLDPNTKIYNTIAKFQVFK